MLPLPLCFINNILRDMLENLLIAYIDNILIYSIPAQQTHKGSGLTYPEPCLCVQTVIRRL